MDDLPLLPFKKVLSYLNLRDRLKSRAVSRRWCQMVDSCKVESLCLSEEPIDRILFKNQVARGVFSQNLISSPAFDKFFKTFGRSIFSHLKHLRLYGLDIQAGTGTTFTRTLNSFVHLEELDLIGKWFSGMNNNKRRVLKLNLPMLKSVQFEQVDGIEKLTLEAPILRKVKLNKSVLKLDLVHGESVELLLVEWGLSGVKVKSLKNLKQLYLGNASTIAISLLFGLDQLKEIHLTSTYSKDVRELFEQKQRYRRSDLKIYHLGCLLDGPGDPAVPLEFQVPRNNRFTEMNLPYLAANLSRLADEIPLRSRLVYTVIEDLTPELQAIFLKRLTDVNTIVLERKVEDVDRFLNFLKTFSHIRGLVLADQRQDLLDRLPDFPIQYLHLLGKPSDLEFLFKLKSLILLDIQFEISTDLILRALQEFEFLGSFYAFSRIRVQIYIETPKESSKSLKLFKVQTGRGLQSHDPNAVIQFIKQEIANLPGYWQA